MGFKALSRALVLLGIIGGLFWFFRSDPGQRFRHQLGEMAESLPQGVKGFTEQVDVNEIADTLAGAAVAELRPAFMEMLGFKRN
jgi:preprotein translocase subunit YajC